MSSRNPNNPGGNGGQYTRNATGRYLPGRSGGYGGSSGAFTQPGWNNADIQPDPGDPAWWNTPGTDVTGQDPWSTDTRPNMFWSTVAPDIGWGIDWSDISSVPGMDDFASQGALIERDTFDRAKGLLDPVFDQREIDMNESLANRGLPVGSSVNATTRDQFGRDMGSAYEKAALDSVFAGRQEQGRLFGQAIQSHATGVNDQLTQIGLGNQARRQAYDEQMGARDQLFRELMGQLGTSDFNPNDYLTETGFDPTNFLNAISGGNAQPSQYTGSSSSTGGVDWAQIAAYIASIAGGGESYLSAGSGTTAADAATGTNTGSVY